jgi:hypothetical protein
VPGWLICAVIVDAERGTVLVEPADADGLPTPAQPGAVAFCQIPDRRTFVAALPASAAGYPATAAECLVGSGIGSFGR